MSWCLVKTQGQLYLYRSLGLVYEAEEYKK